MKRSNQCLAFSTAVVATTLLLAPTTVFAADDAPSLRHAYMVAVAPPKTTTTKPSSAKSAGAKATAKATAKSPAKSAQAKPSESKASTDESAQASLPSVETGVPQSPGLTAALSAYKSHPDASQWPQIWKELRELISSPQVMRASAGSILHANPLLTDVGVKVDDAAGARVWAFPKAADSQAVLVQYLCPVGSPTKKVVGKGRHRKVIVEPAPTVTKLQLISLPPSMAFKDAQIVRGGGKSDLILAGNERLGGTIMIVAHRLSDGAWAEDTGVLSSIPPFLVQNVAGSPSFSGNDLVLTLGGANAQASGYKIVLKFVDGKFAMEGQAADAGPAMVASQFVQCIQTNRLDIARAWLVDPKLICVPKYAGLLSKGGTPFKIIGMSAPLFAGARFRVMTFDKNDLILDIAKVKNVWAIKGVFIAAPDPLAQKLVGTLPAPTATHSEATGKALTEK